MVAAASCTTSPFVPSWRMYSYVRSTIIPAGPVNEKRISVSVLPSLLQNEAVDIDGGLETILAGYCEFPFAVISFVGDCVPCHNKETVVIAVGAVSFTAQILIFLIRKESMIESASVDEADELFAMIEHSRQPRVIELFAIEEDALYRNVLRIIG